MTAPERLSQLREQGFEVIVHHLRHPELRLKNYKGQVKTVPGSGYYNQHELRVRGLKSYPRGGQTVVEISYDGMLVAIGRAFVHPNDAYDKRLGLTKALGRAIGQLEKANAGQELGV